MRRRTLLHILPAAAALPNAAQAQSHPLLEQQAAQILAQAEKELASPQSWEPLRAQRRKELQAMLGLDPWPARTPLNVQIRGTLDRDDHTVEKITFESIPKFYVTANLYLPKQRRGKVPVIVYVCGHAMVPEGAKTYYQRHGISFARNGYACLIVDPIQISEVFSLHHGVYALQLYDWYARGYTPAGIDVWNAIRAIDYLASRPEIDIAKCGMTGRSGGAAMTWFTAALDDRIKVAAPVMGISTYLANLREDTQKRHCDCMFPINFHRHDMTHQGALIAPRPLLMAHGKKDDLFPVPGYTKFEEMLTKLYKGYNHPERFTNIVVDTGHQDSDFLREQVLRWFDKHLTGIQRDPEMAYQNAKPAELTVFSGKPPADAINPRVHLLFKPIAKPQPNLLHTLKTQVFRHALTQKGNPRTRVKAPQQPGRYPGFLYITPIGEEASLTSNFFRLGGLPAETVLLTAQAFEWQPNEYRGLLRNAMHVGTTPETIRLQDVLAAVDELLRHPQVDSAKIVIAGRGIDAAIALYAAALDTRITDVLLINPPETHIRGPIFLNILRHTDIAGTAAALAPRKLHFFHYKPPVFQGPHMREVYSLAQPFAV
ncbi:MAG: acetylxylan esterase [Acidobacteria bacterium]|nr:acetylxylan esterase [Acidobacteriota bacterium]